MSDVKQDVCLFEMQHPIQDQLLDSHAAVLTQALKSPLASVYAQFIQQH